MHNNGGGFRAQAACSVQKVCICGETVPRLRLKLILRLTQKYNYYTCVIKNTRGTNYFEASCRLTSHSCIKYFIY